MIASFDQFRGFGVGEPIESLFVTIPRRSSVSRTLFVGLENPPADPSAAPDVLVPVQVDQVPDASGAAAFDMVYLNPDFENPDFENPDFENGSFQVADTTWPVRNNGNTTSAYKANVYVNDPPAGVKYQLAVRKIFTSPAAVCAVPGSTTGVSRGLFEARLAP